LGNKESGVAILSEEAFASQMNEQTAGSQVVSPSMAALVETEEPPSTGWQIHGVRHPIWHDVPDRLWQDWRWQRQHAIRTTAQLAEVLPLSAVEISALEGLEAKYRMAIPPYYFSLIDFDDPQDPIRLQAVPSPQEDANHSGVELDDPLEEDQDSPVPGITHRYPDRALVITTPVCSMYCRFCTRKRVTMDREGWDAPSHDEQRMIDYIRSTPAIRDVILSGGDPLTLPVAKLRWFITELATIEHVDVIRVGSRVPVTLPQRLFDSELIDLLAAAEKIWIQTHFNHPREITPEATQACRALVNAGMPVSNHAVLLKGVNDSVDIMRELVRDLLRIKVRPYYLFHCDPVTGAGHFRTSIWKGIEIIEGLRGHVSGLGVPTYVVDGLHGAGKIPVMPNYLISAADNAVVLRNYEGMIFRYAPEDQQSDAPAVASQGVSDVLSGTGKPLVPPSSPRHARRKKKALDQVQVEAISTDSLMVSAKAARRSTNGVKPKIDGTAGSTNGKSGDQKTSRGRRAAVVTPVPIANPVPLSSPPDVYSVGSSVSK
jgi:lysine 2,3-aminomutase